MNTRNYERCNNCLWGDQCRDDPRCDDYTPLDPSCEDITYYDSVLAENYADYELMVQEYSDGN